MVSIRSGLILSSVSKRNARGRSTRFMSKQGRNPGTTGKSQKQQTNAKRPWKTEENTMMDDADFTNLYILVEAATRLAENRAQKGKRGNKVKGNPPHPHSQNFVVNEACGDFRAYTTRSGQHYLGMAQGEEAILNDEKSRERRVQLQESPPKKLKVKTAGAVQPQESPPKTRKVKTAGAVESQESSPKTLKGTTTGTTTGAVQLHQRPKKQLTVQNSGTNSMVPYERVPADSVRTPENTGANLLEISKGVCAPAATTRIGLNGIAVYNESTCGWTAYIWDGKKFYIDDSVEIPQNTGADSVTTRNKSGAGLLEIRNGVCLPDPTKLGLLGVNFYKRIGRWTAHIWDGKQYYIGSYGSATEAARAYDKASLKHLDATAAQPNYKGICDYSEDVEEMAKLTNKQFRELLNKRARLSKHVHVGEGVTKCPEGRLEVKIKLQAEKKWKFLGRFDNLGDATRWYQMVSRWYVSDTSTVAL